jgi:hypothetical protein
MMGNWFMAKVGATSTGTKNATDPKMIARFAEFDPMTPPKNIACLPRLTAVMEVANSGTLVPNATIVSPTTLSETPSAIAIAEAPSTKKFEPTSNPTNPPTVNA